MLGTKTIISSLLLCAAFSAHAQDFFPLQVGNTWVYRVVEGRVKGTATVEVEAIEPIAGRNYYRVQFFDRTVFLRPTEGSILALDRSRTRCSWRFRSTMAGLFSRRRCQYSGFRLRHLRALSWQTCRYSGSEAILRCRLSERRRRWHSTSLHTD